MEEGKEMQRQRGFLHFYDTEMEEDPMALPLSMSCAYVQSVENFSQGISLNKETIEHAETKENSQRRPNNNNIVTKYSQGSLVPSQRLQVVF